MPLELDKVIEYLTENHIEFSEHVGIDSDIRTVIIPIKQSKMVLTETDDNWGDMWGLVEVVIDKPYSKLGLQSAATIIQNIKENMK